MALFAKILGAARCHVLKIADEQAVSAVRRRRSVRPKFAREEAVLHPFPPSAAPPSARGSSQARSAASVKKGRLVPVVNFEIAGGGVRAYLISVDGRRSGVRTDMSGYVLALRSTTDRQFSIYFDLVLRRAAKRKAEYFPIRM